MNKKTRTLVLILLTLVFFVITPIIVRLSQGYRFDFSQRKFVQTGAIYLKTKPEEITLILDGKEKLFKSSSLIYNGILLKNLIPQIHRLSLKATDAYFTWEKNLTLEPLLVSKATRIVLPLRQPEITEIPVSSSTFKFFSFLSDTQLLYSLDSKLVQQFDYQNQTTKSLFDLSKIRGIGAQETVAQILASSAKKNLIALTQTQGILQTQDKIYPLNSYLEEILTDSKIKLGQLKFIWHPQNDNLFFAIAPNALYLINIENHQSELLIQDKIIGLQPTDQAHSALNSKGEIYTFSLTGSQATSTPVAQLETASLAKGFYTIYSVKDGLLLWNDAGHLVFADLVENKVLEISRNATLLKLSDDKSRLAYIASDGKVSVRFLEEVFDDIKYEPQEQLELNLPAANAKIEQIYFTNDNWYLVLVSRNQITISEIDKRSPLNYWQPKLTGSIFPLEFQANHNKLIWTNKQNILTAELMP